MLVKKSPLAPDFRWFDRGDFWRFFPRQVPRGDPLLSSKVPRPGRRLLGPSRQLQTHGYGQPNLGGILSLGLSHRYRAFLKIKSASILTASPLVSGSGAGAEPQ